MEGTYSHAELVEALKMSTASLKRTLAQTFTSQESKNLLKKNYDALARQTAELIGKQGAEADKWLADIWAAA